MAWKQGAKMCIIILQVRYLCLILYCLDLLGPVIWEIVNLSLETSVMPTELKQAVIRPLLKKPGLDHQHYTNFWPISNLTFLSKVIEKVVALQ